MEPISHDLLSVARAKTHRALEGGIIEPFLTETVPHEDRGDVFSVRRLVEIPKKPSGHKPNATDPFLPPYEPALLVAELSPDHVILLNRYPVLDDHLLIVTRQWEDQEMPPTEGDLSSLERVLSCIDGLGFYNGGVDAGASQPHRHLQIVPRTSFGPGGIPLQPAVCGALAQGLSEIEHWPFVHRLAPQEPRVADTFTRLWAAIEWTGPFSLLCTRQWMMLVPRSTGHVRGIPINSLGYAGSLVVKDEAQQAQLATLGAWAVLTEAGISR